MPSGNIIAEDNSTVSVFSQLVDVARDLPDEMLKEELLRLRKLRTIAQSRVDASDCRFDINLSNEELLQQVDDAEHEHLH